jgi:hypothetical protein
MPVNLFADVACSPTSRPLELSAYSGVFTSQNFPNNYNNNADCQWRIISAESTGVRTLRLIFQFRLLLRQDADIPNEAL